MNIASLIREKYEKFKKIYENIQYVNWDKNQNTYLAINTNDIEIEIKPALGISKVEMKAVSKIITKWLHEIHEKEFKGYDSLGSQEAKKLYIKTAYEFLKTLEFIEKAKNNPSFNADKLKGNLYWYFLKEKEQCLGIGLSVIPIDEKQDLSNIVNVLVYPESQYPREVRKDGNKGCCGCNLITSMVNHIFSHKFVKSIEIKTENYKVCELLKILKFSVIEKKST